MRLFSRIASLLIVLSLLGISLALAMDDITEDMADRIQARYEAIRSFKTDFVQVQTRAVIGISTESRGEIWYRNPSLVRWETREPEEAKETIVVGPETVWDYIADLDTATKMPLPQMLNSKTLLRFISGQANLKEDFRVESVWDGDERLKEHWKDSGLVLLRLVPHQPEAGMMLAYLGVEPETFVLRRIMTVDYQGNANEIHLTTLQLDVDVPDATFEFTPPEGAMVQDNTQPEPGQEGGVQ
jgi:outer membrane lipoprotein carrier protein